jgi:hypothetical protein
MIQDYRKDPSAKMFFFSGKYNMMFFSADTALLCNEMHFGRD